MACYLWFEGVNSLFSVIDSAFHWSNIIFSESEFVFADDCIHIAICSILLFKIKNKALAQNYNIQSSSEIEENRHRIIYSKQVFYQSILSYFHWAVEYLTIIPRARMGYWLRGHESERNNCFSKIQLVGQKYQDKTTFSW